MTIAETRKICKDLIARVPRDLFLVAILVLASLFSFGFGYLTGLDAAGQGNGVVLVPSPLVASTTDSVVASRNGTKYYLSWCTGAERISEANKVRFASAADAIAAGYAPAVNCEGL